MQVMHAINCLGFKLQLYKVSQLSCSVSEHTVALYRAVDRGGSGDSPLQINDIVMPWKN